MRKMLIRSAFLTACCSLAGAAFLPPGDVRAAGARNVVLAYLDARSADPASEFAYSANDFLSLIACRPRKASACAAPLFDAVLLLGYEWDAGACFWPGACPRPLNATDAMRILDLWVGMGVANLEAAGALAPALPPTKLFLAIPYPDTRQQDYGVAPGLPPHLNFSRLEDRIAACTWWIDAARARVAALAPARLELVGWYWFLEDVPPGDEALTLAVAAHAHGATPPQRLAWIPSYSGYARMSAPWRSFGFDFVTLQPNVAFYNVSPPARFDNVSAFMAADELGAELELPAAVRNRQPPISGNASESFALYAAAAAQHGWVRGALKSYYLAGDFRLYAAADANESFVARYEAICALANGTFGD